MTSLKSIFIFNQINSCNKGQEKLYYKKINIANSIDGIY